VSNIEQKRTFRKGNCIGEADIILGRHYRMDSFMAETDCYMLKMSRKDTLHMIEEFPEIGDEFKEWVRTKELIRTDNSVFKQIEVPD
jgi:hypothetical protein